MAEAQRPPRTTSAQKFSFNPPPTPEADDTTSPTADGDSKGAGAPTAEPKRPLKAVPEASGDASAAETATGNGPSGAESASDGGEQRQKAKHDRANKPATDDSGRQGRRQPNGGRRKGQSGAGASRKSTRLSASDDANVPQVGGTVPTVDFMAGLDESRVKDWGMVPPSLGSTVSMARIQWAANNPEWCGVNGGPPTEYGFKEALIRLGLKHLNDAEMATMLPRDMRRRTARGASSD